jgi:hypothetical protein
LLKGWLEDQMPPKKMNFAVIEKMGKRFTEDTAMTRSRMLYASTSFFPGYRINHVA